MALRLISRHIGPGPVLGMRAAHFQLAHAALEVTGVDGLGKVVFVRTLVRLNARQEFVEKMLEVIHDEVREIPCGNSRKN
jgi:hypothetical protein